MVRDNATTGPEDRSEVADTSLIPSEYISIDHLSAAEHGARFRPRYNLDIATMNVYDRYFFFGTHYMKNISILEEIGENPYQ